MIELWHLVHNLFFSSTRITETEVMLVVLGLIDVVMIANLLIMVIIGGYETFVSQTRSGRPSRPARMALACQCRGAQDQAVHGDHRDFLDTPPEDLHQRREHERSIRSSGRCMIHALFLVLGAGHGLCRPTDDPDHRAGEGTARRSPLRRSPAATLGAALHRHRCASPREIHEPFPSSPTPLRQAVEGSFSSCWRDFHGNEREPEMTPIKQEDFIQSVADAFQYISYYHPLDYIKALGAAYEREQSPAAQGRDRADSHQQPHVRRRAPADLPGHRVSQ
jgi:hypothetical protein